MDLDPSHLFGLAGGCLIGAGSLLALVVTRKVPGISGIFVRLLRPRSNDVAWRLVFLAGLLAGALLVFRSSDHAALFRLPEGRSLLLYGMAGLLVGFGTRLGGGCTSGHGVCGTGMGARDSMVATAVFMMAGFATVAIFSLIVGGGS